MKAKILGAYAEQCEYCGGIVCKLLTSLGIVYRSNYERINNIKCNYYCSSWSIRCSSYCSKKV